MMRVLATAAILLFTALSGCLADDAEPAAASETPSPTPSGNATATQAPSNVSVPNTPPTANLSSDLPNGTAPLNVTFTVEGDDEDGDALNWTLDADGDGTADYNGTELPSTIVHEYVEAGNYTALLNVTDAEAFVTANLTLVIEIPALGSPMCERPGASTINTAGGATFYTITEGGDWVFRETNGVPGLQVENNHPVGEPGWVNPAWVGCVDGDQMMN